MSKVFSLMLTVLILTKAYADSDTLQSSLAQFRRNSLGIRFTKTVPLKYRQLINQDLFVLKNILVDDPNLEAQNLFKMTPSSTNYEKWLAERVHYITSETFELEFPNVVVLKENHNYPNKIFLDEQEPEKHSENSDQSSTESSKKISSIMSHLAVAVYTNSKNYGILSGMDLPGIGIIGINSPRAGVVKVGNEHFLPDSTKGTKIHIDSQASSLSRLSVMFHEARHSDGNGKSLGFFHAVCPKGHNFSGYAACDLSINGAYATGATFLKSSIKHCEKCSEAEKEYLRNSYMDFYSRILVNKSDKGAVWDDEPEYGEFR